MTSRHFSPHVSLKTATTILVLSVVVALIGSVSASPTQQEQTTLTFAVHWDPVFQERQEEFDALFTERHPDITIEYILNTWEDHQTAVTTWASAGELPDIVYVHGSRAYPWATEGILIDLNPYIEADPEFNVEGIFPVALSLYQNEGGTYAIPYDHGPILLGYNLDAFDAAGMEYPDETWTMDDFREAAIALTIPGQQWGYGGFYGTINLGNEGAISHLAPWGGATFNEDETGLLLDTDESREALNFWFSLMHEEHAIPNQEETASMTTGIWLTGQAAMMGMPSWETPQMTEFATYNWDVAPWPEGPAGRATGAFGSGFGITSGSENPDAAWTYLREYLSQDGMEFMWGSTGRGSPAREAAYPSWLESEFAPEHAQYYLDALANYAITGRPYQSVTGPQVADVIGQNNTLLHAGEITVDQFIANVMEQSAPIFEQQS